MSLARKIKVGRHRRMLRTRAKLDTHMPRVSVFRSLKHIYAQIINDQAQTTLVGFSSLQLEGSKSDKKTIAFMVGQELAKRAVLRGINRVIFDRGGFLYHGRVKSLADGMRDGGLTI